MSNWLKGKKTYILAALAVLTALIDFLATGNFSLEAWFAFLQTSAVAGAFATLRAGISEGLKKPE